MTELTVRAEPIKYEVTKYPQGSVNGHLFTLYVERRDVDKWCVSDGFSRCFTADGERVWESQPSSRTDDFKARTRFPLEEAIEIAKGIVDTMTQANASRGKMMTAEEMWEWEQEA